VRMSDDTQGARPRNTTSERGLDGCCLRLIGSIGAVAGAAPEPVPRNTG
jgi:hypothetical protein